MIRTFRTLAVIQLGFLLPLNVVLGFYNGWSFCFAAVNLAGGLFALFA